MGPALRLMPFCLEAGQLAASGEENGPDGAARKEGAPTAPPAPVCGTNRETGGLAGVGDKHQADEAGPSWPCGHTHGWGHLRSGRGPAEPSSASGQEHPEPMGWDGQRCTHIISNLHLHNLTCGPTLSHITPELTAPSSSRAFAKWGN